MRWWNANTFNSKNSAIFVGMAFIHEILMCGHIASASFNSERKLSVNVSVGFHLKRIRSNILCFLHEKLIFKQTHLNTDVSIMLHFLCFYNVLDFIMGCHLSSICLFHNSFICPVPRINPPNTKKRRKERLLYHHPLKVRILSKG